MNPHPDIFFLLGGYDLEMVEIRRLLESCNLQEGRDFADLRLGWGAKLSAYAAVLEDPQFGNRVFAGIELAEDITPPLGYRRIDHHNDFDDRPAAIVQIAELLGLTLTRWQMLVAANDARYIPGMLEMGASQAEIDQIRRADRQAQGVTEVDERAGEEAVAAKQEVGNLTVVQSKTGKFSTITDRLFGVKRLLIYTEEELTYYGEGKDYLAKSFQAWINQGRAYHGGGPNGYFGIGKGATKQELEAARKEIVSLLNGGTHG
jgi:hypothetical protein